MLKKIEYASFKKLLIFGTKGTGKTSLAKTFEENYFFEEVEPSKTSKNIIINNIFNRHRIIKNFKNIKK